MINQLNLNSYNSRLKKIILGEIDRDQEIYYIINEIYKE